MRSDAQEAALGLLGLTGNLDFSKTTTTTTTTAPPGLSASSSTTSSSHSYSSSNSIVPILGSKRKTPHSVVVSASAMVPRPPSHPQSRSLAILLNNDEDDLESGSSRPLCPPPSLAVHSDRAHPPATTTANNTSAATTATTATTATASSDGIDCVCGFTYDDGFSVACDSCGTWVHAACFDIQHGNVPEIFKCWKCDKRRWDVEKLRERAVRLQRAQQAREKKELDLLGVAGEVDGGGGGRKRVSSPGVDRKRRVSVAAIDQGGQATKRRRRLSTGAGGQQHSTTTTTHSGQQAYLSHSNLTNGGGGGGGAGVGGEEEHVEIDEPATHSYVHTDKDLIPHQHTRDRLKLLAQHWRGVTALESDEDHLNTPTAPVYLTPDELTHTNKSPKTSIYPLPKSALSQNNMHPALSANMNVQVRPPSYTVRTTQPIPSESFIAPYTSTIIPSTVYLSDPLNSYAHLGMPKPFVHLVGPPLDVALDARLAGNGSRFVRSGCRPNAVIRPVLCRKSRQQGEDEEEREREEEEEGETLTFGVFALRDLKAQEEVVLGWEWDDGSVIHHLPALIDTPHLFAPARFEQYRHQMTSMLHALSSTFPTCACGARARDCALNRLAEFVDGQSGRTPPTPSTPSPPSSFSFSRDYPIEEGERNLGLGLGRGNLNLNLKMGMGNLGMQRRTALGPLIGTKRGFRTRERVPMSGGMSGVEMDPSSSSSMAGGVGSGWAGLCVQPEAGPSRSKSVGGMERTGSGSSESTDGDGMSQSLKGDKKGKGKGKGRAMDQDQDQDVVMESEGVRGVAGGPKKSKKPLSTSIKSTSSAESTARPSPQPDLRVHPDYGPTPSIPTRVGEAKLPPKLRKKWIHKNLEVLKESCSPTGEMEDKERGSPDRFSSQRRDGMDVDDDTKVMPPPPLPISVSSPSRTHPIRDLPSRADPSFLSSPLPPSFLSSSLPPSLLPSTPTPIPAVSVPAVPVSPVPAVPAVSHAVPAVITVPAIPASPVPVLTVPAELTSFANMSLLSPANGPAPHFPGCFGRVKGLQGLQGVVGGLADVGQVLEDGDVDEGGEGGGVQVLEGGCSISTADVDVDVDVPSADVVESSRAVTQEQEDKSSLDEGMDVMGDEGSEDVPMEKEKECEDQSVVEAEAGPTDDDTSKVSPVEKTLTPPPPPQSPIESTHPEVPTPPSSVAEKADTQSETEDATPTPGLSSVGDLPPEQPQKVDNGDTAMAIDDPPPHEDSVNHIAPAAPSESDAPSPEVTVAETTDEKPTETEVEPQASIPSPPAPPAKVKLTLKDFKLRMRKKREEEAAASPVVASVPLAPEGAGALVAEGTAAVQEQAMQPLSTDVQVDATKSDMASAEPLRSPSPVREPPAKTSATSPLPSPGLIQDNSTTKSLSMDSADVQAADGQVQQQLSKVERDSPVGDKTASPKPVSVPDKMDVDEHKDVGMTLQAKIEVVEPRLSIAHVERKAPSRFSAALSEDRLPPSRSRSPVRRTPPADDRPFLRTCSPLARSESPRRSEYSRKENHEPFHLPDRPTMGPPRTIHQPLARQISQEDGEIFSPPPPKPLPLAPRARTPPTRPRLFPHSTSGNTSPTRGPPSSLPPRRPLQPSTYRPQLPPAASSRPLPSGPRALRGVGNNGPTSYNSSSSYNSSFSSRADGPHTAPRGPSADRDRERERVDWDRDRRVGPSWSRSRGSGWPR